MQTQEEEAMKNGWMDNKKVKRIITVVVAIAVMIGMVVPTVAMEDGETAADVLTAEEILLEESGQPAEEDEGEKPSKESGQQGDTSQEETDKTESRAEEETTPEQENIPPIQDESVKKDAGDATKEQKQEVNPLFSLDETKLLAPVLPSTDVFAPFDLIDPDETLIYPGVKVIWYNKNGTETSAPAGASITAVLMDKGPQDSYPDWVPSQNRLGTSKNTEVLNAANGFDGWFDNIIKMRSKKLVVSGVPSGYTVTYDDNSTSNEYPAGYDPEYFYINLTKSDSAPVTLSKIEVTTAPSKTVYTAGESFSKAGMVVKATYSDGSSKVVTSYTYSPTGALAAGVSQITISYEEGGVQKTTTTPITVNAAPVPVLDSIEVTAQPTKTAYTVGDTFDPAGLEVTAYYTNDGADKVLTSGEYTLSTPDMSAAGTKMITVTYEEDGIEKTATFDITVNAPAPVLDSIEVTAQPTKTIYTVGDTFDAAGLEVTAHYTNGGADKILTSGEYTLSAPDMGTAGTKTVTVTYEESGIEKTATFSITVNAPAPVLDSIEVTENPTKTTYTVGDTFNPSGLEVTAHYTNGGADKVLTSGEYTLSTPDMSTSGTKTITVTYEEDGVEKTATFDITVNAPVPVLDSIEVTENPTQTTYTVGDTFDAAGLEVTAHYTNGGADKVLTSGEYTLSTPDMSVAGTKTITVTYEEDGVEKTATFNITVNALVPVLDSIEVTEQPTKTTYTVGDTFNPSGLEVTAHYTNGGADKVLTSGEYTLSAPDMGTSGTKTVTVTYEEDGVEKTASFDITVNAPAPVLDSIEVTEQPTKTTYTVGDTFDAAGLEITAHYTNGGADKVLTSGEYTLSTPDMSAAGTKMITVTYEEDGIEKTATFDITVNAPAPVLDSIEVTAQPTKTIYTVGDTFDAAGLEVTAHYTNGGADKVLTSGEYTLSTPDMSTAGTKTVTVTYEEDGVEKTATFDITVNALVPVLDMIEITKQPVKTAYTVGDAFDPTGLEVKAHYTNGGAHRVLGDHEYALSAPDMSTSGTKTVTVTYEENGVQKTDTFDIVLADAVTPTPTPDPTVSPEPSAGAEPVAGVTDDDNTGNGGEHDSMPKTGVEDTTPAMMVLLAIAALMTVILFAQLMKKENTMIRNGEGAIGTREKFGRRIRNKVLGKVLGIVLAVELHKETTGKQSKK